MKWRRSIRMVIVLVMLCAAWLLGAVIAHADGPTPPDATQIAQRLQEEPQLYCFAQQLGVSADIVAIGKMRFDYEFGSRHGLVTLDQWRATWPNRWRAFADFLGIANPYGTPQCGRQVEALRRLGIVKDNPVWIK